MLTSFRTGSGVRRWCAGGVCTGLTLATIWSAVAQDGASGRGRRLKDLDVPGLAETITLDSIEPWDVVQLIEFLAHRGRLSNIVIGQGVSGLTTKLKFSAVTVGDALEIVLSVNKLAYEMRGGILSIMTDKEYMDRNGVSFYDNKQIKVVELKYADAERLTKLLEPVKSTIGTIVSDAKTGNLIMIDTPERIKEMESIVEKQDIATIDRVLPTQTKAFVLQYGNVETVSKEVLELLTKEVGKMRVDARTKTIVVTDLPHRIEVVSDLIQVFDRRPKQVFIEAKIVQVSLGQDFQFGINWNHVFESLSDPRLKLGSTVKPGIITPGGGVGSINLSTVLGHGNLDAIVDALQETGDTRIRSNPHVAVLDGQEATIKVVRDEPYAESSLESGTTNVVGETFKFIEVGVSLAVTPRINDDGMISMLVRPEVSTVEDKYTARYTVPVVQKSYAETSVMVKDGETIIIAGMIETTNADKKSAVPWLGRIPLLGWLFSSRSESTQNKETVVFLTPRIITGEEQVQMMDDVHKDPKPLRTSVTSDKQPKPTRVRSTTPAE